MAPKNHAPNQRPDQNHPILHRPPGNDSHWHTSLSPMEIQTVFPHHTAPWQILRPNAGNVHVENLGLALELTYNYYGSEDDETNWYHVGNQEKDRFGHVAFNTQECYSKINAMRVLSRDWPCLRSRWILGWNCKRSQNTDTTAQNFSIVSKYGPFDGHMGGLWADHDWTRAQLNKGTDPVANQISRGFAGLSLSLSVAAHGSQWHVRHHY